MGQLFFKENKSILYSAGLNKIPVTVQVLVSVPQKLWLFCKLEPTAAMTIVMGAR